MRLEDEAVAEGVGALNIHDSSSTGTTGEACQNPRGGDVSYEAQEIRTEGSGTGKLIVEDGKTRYLGK